MAKDRKKLLHIHSSVNDKQPTPSSLEAGELAVNNAADNAFISTKNSNGNVVRFSEDGTIIDWIEMKEVFPYEGYVRGSNSGVTGVTEADLLQNKSNIIVKINQVAARNSEYDEKINGAKDIYGNPINPISTDGYRDGAGIAIDMSPYAMVGSNPSFSSLTTTCGAHFNGTTEIEGTNGDCGSEFNVNVENVCIDAGDSLNEYGENSTNVGVSCDGRSISNNTTIKGKKINIISPEGDTSLDIKACSQISSVTDNYVVRECTDGHGSVEIDTTVVGVSADTTDIKSCTSVDVKTNNLNVTECSNGQGNIKVDTTIVNVSADTTDIKSCNLMDVNTNKFKVAECNDGQGNVEIDTTIINVSGNTTNIESCNLMGVKTNKLNITECNDGQGEIEINSCKGISAKTDNFVIGSCSSGGTTTIKSCGEIKLESKNIVLTDGDCGSGEITIEVDDLCLVGNDKINVYGDKTNVGIDCDDSKVATKTRVYGSNVEVSGNSTDILSKNTNIVGENTSIIAVDEICEKAEKSTFYGSNTTNIGVDCSDNATAATTNVKGETINIEATNDANVIANEICESASTDATFYGAVSTNVGVNCDKTVTSTTTDVRGGSVIVDASVGRLGLTAKQDILESSEQDIIITANRNVCERAGSSASFYGVSSTNIGITCEDDNVTSLVNILGNTVSASGDVITIDADTSIEQNAVNGEININAHDINIESTNTLCEKGLDSYFYGENSTHIGRGCDGQKSASIVYERIPGSGTCDIKASTIDGALDEVFDRDKIHFSSITGVNSVTYEIWQDSGSCENRIQFTIDDTIVSMSAETLPASAEIAKVYTLYQTTGDRRVEIGTINIPKDHILKDVAIKHGHYDDATSAFTECEDYEPKSGCTYYIKMVWNIFDSGHTDDRTVYLPADDFIQDIDEDNSYSGRGVTVDVWYDGNKNRVSADTRLNFETPSDTNDFMYAKHDGQHWESGTTIIFNSGDVSGFTQAKYKPWSTSTEINIPTCVGHLNRHMIKFQSGDASTFIEQTFDPGSDCANSAETINIPTSIEHLNRGTLTVKHNDFEKTYDPASSSAWELPHNVLTTKYGEDVSEMSGETIYYSTSADTEIKIPTCVSNLKRATLEWQYGSTCNASGNTYDPGSACDNDVANTIIIPKTIADITNDAISIDECSGDCISINTDVNVNGVVKATALYSSSDERLKENIDYILHSDYSKADEINLKKFNFKDDETKKTTYGVLAQDVLAANLENIVHTDENGYLSVDYISLLILKIASLEHKVENLTTQLEALKKG